MSRKQSGTVERIEGAAEGEIWPVASAVPFDGSGPCAAGILQRPRRVRLGTPNEIAREMARVYREMRSGALDSSEGTKLVFVLTQIGRLLVQAPPEPGAVRLVEPTPMSPAVWQAMRDYIHEF